jgi:hypothetical protein
MEVCDCVNEQPKVMGQLMGWVVDKEGRGGRSFAGEELRLRAVDDDWSTLVAGSLLLPSRLAPRSAPPALVAGAAPTVFIVPGSGTAPGRGRAMRYFS